MFGRIDGPVKRKEFSVIRSRGGFTYRRGDRQVRLVSKDIALDVLPLAPVNLPERITGHFIVNFDKIHIGPRERLVLFLKVPVEVGVFFGDERIDVFGFVKEEFSLYGPVDGGIVAREVAGEEVEEEKIKWDGRSAVIPLRIKNYTSSARHMSRVILNADYLEMYYDGKKAATEMVKLDLREVPRVRYVNKAYFKGLKKVEAKKQLLRKEEVEQMEWGL